MNNLTVLGTIKKTPIAFDCYNTSTGNSTSTVNQDRNMPLDVIRYASGNFTLNSYVVTVNSDMVANIVYRISTDVVSNSGFRTISRAVLQLDSGDGIWQNVAGTYSFMYNRMKNEGESTSTVSVILSLQAGYKLRVLFRKISGNDIIQAVAQGCGLTITAL